MNTMEKLEYGNFYHIYNRGINSANLFLENENYEYFLRLYEKYVHPIADTFAWCLLKNHFHLLVRLKDENKIKIVNSKDEKKLHPPHIYFSHLFNSYTQAFNKRNNRTGNLFQRPFKRILIKDEMYLKYLVYYIHHNPVKHGFVEDMIEYPWSSYLSIVSPKKTKMKKEEVIQWFDDIENYKYFHSIEQSLDKIKNFI